MVDLITSTKHPDDSGLNPFKELMQNADGSGDNTSFGDSNPGIVDSLTGVATRNLDHLASNPGDDTIADGSQRGKFFTLLATDDDAYNELSRNVGAYQQLNLTHAFDEDQKSSIAGMENSRLDAYLRGGFVNEREIANQGDYEESMADYKQNRAAMELGRDAVTGLIGNSGVGKVSGVAPLANSVMDDIIDSSLDKPELQTYDTSIESNEEYAKTRSGYEYMAAAYQDDPDSLASNERRMMTDPDGKLKSFDQIDNDDYDRLERYTDYPDSDSASDAERGRNVYVSNNQFSNTFDQIHIDPDNSSDDAKKDIDEYLDGKNPAPAN